MALAPRAKVVLQPQMQLQGAALIPRAAAPDERGRLGNLGQAQHAAVKVFRALLLTARRRHLHVVEAEHHRRCICHASPPNGPDSPGATSYIVFRQAQESVRQRML